MDGSEGSKSGRVDRATGGGGPRGLATAEILAIGSAFLEGRGGAAVIELLLDGSGGGVPCDEVREGNGGAEPGEAEPLVGRDVPLEFDPVRLGGGRNLGSGLAWV